MTLLNVSSSLRTRSDTEQIDPSIVQLIVSEFTKAQYFDVALLTLLVYHSLITLDKEVVSHRCVFSNFTFLSECASQIKYFWPNPCSTVSIVYFALSPNIGAALIRISDLITVVLIDYILLIRVLAFYHQNRKVAIALKILLGLEASIDLVILIYGTILQEVTTFRLTERMVICGQGRAPLQVLAIVSWAVPMVYGLILLSLALYKAAEYWKLSSGFTGFHLVRVLIQDQVIYYGLVIFCSICQIMFESLANITSPVEDILNIIASPTILCILGGQLLINLKEAGERGANGGTNYTPRSFSGIEFGENGAANEQSLGDEGSV
ncbi:hypothetical protein A7U60_g9142 [Sanghuangporus baumii]|uniref:Uncharacterized protein n=1 Tax=Sanghuangporus baumii TaxID=108892 RepID=A0A9Q5HQ65_SANBA|nr:hypothetical protein A7U60_g9142 [Sanghuangporus baumii]